MLGPVAKCPLVSKISLGLPGRPGPLHSMAEMAGCLVGFPDPCEHLHTRACRQRGSARRAPCMPCSRSSLPLNSVDARTPRSQFLCPRCAENLTLDTQQVRRWSRNHRTSVLLFSPPSLDAGLLSDYPLLFLFYVLHSATSTYGAPEADRELASPTLLRFPSAVIRASEENEASELDLGNASCLPGAPVKQQRFCTGNWRAFRARDGLL